MKYIVIDERFDGTGDAFTEEFNEKDVAIKKAIYHSDHLTRSEHKDRVVYVLESVNPREDAEDHFDGDVVWVDGMET